MQSAAAPASALLSFGNRQLPRLRRRSFDAGIGFMGDRAGSSRMARKPGTRVEFVLFDVFYEDGSQRSNRKVPSVIAEKSGLPALPIKSVRRSGGKD
jgi:hypothetical protein